MAPIQSLSAYSIQNSSLNMIPTICHCGLSIINDWEWWLPVSRRGLFFQDSFFEDARAHIDAAVKEALSKWGEMVSQHHNAALSLSDNLNRYRQLRAANRLEENLARTLVTDKTHKIVMDVHDFMDGDIKVKVVGEKEVLVEGQGHGLLSSQTFSRRFCFPETVSMATVTSVLSSDGVLTIEAPKNGRTVKISSFAGSSQKADISEKNTKKSLINHSEDSKCCSVESEEHNKVYYCKDCKKKIGPWHNEPQQAIHKEGIKIPIQIDTAITKDHQTSSSSTAQTVTSAKPKNNSQIKEIKIEKDESYAKEKEELKNERIEENHSAHKNKAVATVENSPCTSALTNSYSVPIFSHYNTFPIIKRGLFFSDSIFEDIRKDFQLAVQEVLAKCGMKSPIMDDLTSYRNLRSRDLQEENQACKITQNETNHKLVLDVHDFMNGGNITVKAINDREIVIEGHIEKQEEGSKSQKRFFKRFVLPGDIQLSSVTSDMSSDGVLTVTAPKKPSTVQLREFTIPLSIEDSEDATKGNKTPVKTSIDAPTKETLKNTFLNNQDSIVLSNKNGSTNSVVSNKAIPLHNTSFLEYNFASSDAHEIKTSERIIPVHVESDCGQSDKKISNIEMSGNQEYHDRQMQNSQSKSIKLSAGNKKTEFNTAQMTKRLSDDASKSDSSLKQTDNHKFVMRRTNAEVAEENKDSNTKGKCLISCGNRRLPIERRGLFFNDSFFEEYHRDFEVAVNDILVKFRENVTEGEMMNTYRNLRQRNLKVENQALRVHEDQNSFKVVLDVKDFTDGDTTVYIEGEELVIEGRTERKEDKASDSLTFSHRFLLPEDTNFSAISSAISSDGVLTINSPKTGNHDGYAVRKISCETESKHENHQGGSHHWEKKNVKESSQQSKGFSSRTLCSSYHSQQQHSSKI